MILIVNPTAELFKGLDIADCDLRVFTGEDYYNIEMAEVDLKDKTVTLFME